MLPGDEVISINGRSLLNHSHHECLQALRAAKGESTLTLRRLRVQAEEYLPTELPPLPPSSPPPDEGDTGAPTLPPSPPPHTTPPSPV